MELDYNDNINEFGENVVRLYNFDKAEAIKFSALIKETIIELKQTHLDTVTSVSQN